MQKQNFSEKTVSFIMKGSIKCHTADHDGVSI